MIKNFMKKYGYYMLAFALILTVGISAGLSAPAENSSNLPKPDISEPTSTVKQEMISPINSPEVIKWYSDTELFYNSTLKQWESHRGVDLTSNQGTDVVAVLDGTVLDCSYSYEDGYCVKIDHSNGLVTTYCSLKEGCNVNIGDSVKQGQKIGEISSSASNESAVGDHLHFSITLNNAYVDPANYLTFENK